MANIDQNELLNKFLEDDLKKDELILFKEKFDNEPDFAHEVKQYVDMKLALKAASRVRLRAGFESNNDRGESRWLTAASIMPPAIDNGSHKRLQSGRTWAIAASIAFIIGVAAYYLFQLQNPPQHKALFAMHYTNPFESDEVITRSDESDPDPLVLADFTLAIELMDNQKFKQAYTILSRLDAMPQNTLTEEIEWYYALCTLRLGKKETAIDMLAHIQSSNSYYSEQARSIYNVLTTDK